MAYQTQWNSYCAFKVQSALGTQSSGGSAEVLRVAGGPGGRLTKAAVESNEVRNDGMRTRGRHGTQKTNASYTTQLSHSEAEAVPQAILRGTYGSANTAITEATASLASITTTTSTIVAGGGSWITAGVKVGDVWRLTGHATSANNSKNLIVTGVTASTITVPAGTLTTDASPDTSFTLTKTGRTLIQPAAGSLVNRYWTVEEYDVDTDCSEVFTDCVWSSMRFSMQPNGIIMVDRSWVGTGQFEVKTAGSAPHFTSPSTSTGVPMSVADASLYVNGTSVVSLTSFDLTIDNKATAPDTFGSAASRYAPDVFTGQIGISLNLSMLRTDVTAVTDFNAETQYSMHILCVENESEPKDFFSIYIPNFTLGGVDKSALSKEGGPRIVTLQVPEALVGKDEAGGAYDATMIKMQVSSSS